MQPAYLSGRPPGRQVTTLLSQRRRRLTRRAFVWFTYLGLFLVTLNFVGNWLNVPQVYAAPIVILKGAPSKPHRIGPTTGAASQTRGPTPITPGSKAPGIPQTIAHTPPMPMKAGSLPLQAEQASSFLGSDGRLELRIPAGAITAQDLAQAGGAITLHVTQIAPASGSNAGGSGEISLGSYLIQLVDAHGNVLSHGLHKPVVALYHLEPKELGLDLAHARLVLNSSPSAGALAMKGVVQPAAGKTLVSTLGTPQAMATSLDTSAKTLTSSMLASSPSTSMSWDSDSPVSTFGKPDPTSVNLSSGSLSYSLPIDIPAGPGGLTPPVNLSYSSESVNGQHNASAAAGWVGEGWSLSMGQVSWSEHNVLAGCTNCSGPEWENEWNLSDAYGTSSQLIPPNINVSTFYDDTPNYYCATGNSAAYPCPILWHTATESHDKIWAYMGPLNINQGMNPPCFRVWLPNGIMEEFGCTLDSLQYYLEAGVGALISSWNLDMITDPQGNQIHFTYQQDVQSWTSPVTGHTFTYARDEQLSSISYDSPGCRNAQSMCTGSSWAPLVQISFNASHMPSILTGTAPTGCNTGASLRCDDPLDLTSSGGVAASMLQSTFVLNSIQVQVRASGTDSWNTLRTYKLGYEQSGPTTITDQASSLKRSIAGMLDLTQITEIGSDGAMALPTVNLAYISLTNYYEDAFDHPTPTTNCGPSWNTGSGSGAVPCGARAM
jgi:hypothetical protein